MGSNSPVLYLAIFTAVVARQSSRRKRFAMMAAEGFGVMWILWCFSAIFVPLSASDSDTGRFSVRSVRCRLLG